MSEYKYNDGSRTDVWVKKMIPVFNSLGTM